MAGEWQREFFLITEDPFYLDQNLFQMWLDGKSVDEATNLRAQNIEARGMRRSSLRIFSGLGRKNEAHELMLKDTALQYEAYEAIEVQLGEPAKFLAFCPVQMEMGMRQEAITRFYALNEVIVREHVILTTTRRAHFLGIPFCCIASSSGPDTKEDIANTAKAHNRQICERTQLPPFQVARTTANIQRVSKWLDDWHPPCSLRPTQGDEEELSSWDTLCEIFSPLIGGQYFRVIFFIVHRFDLQGSRHLRVCAWSQIDDVLNLLFTSRMCPAPELPEYHQLMHHYDFKDGGDPVLEEVCRILKLRFDLFKYSIKQRLELVGATMKGDAGGGGLHSKKHHREHVGGGGGGGGPLRHPLGGEQGLTSSSQERSIAEPLSPLSPVSGDEYIGISLQECGPASPMAGANIIGRAGIGADADESESGVCCTGADTDSGFLPNLGNADTLQTPHNAQESEVTSRAIDESRPSGSAETLGGGTTGQGNVGGGGTPSCEQFRDNGAGGGAGRGGGANELDKQRHRPWSTKEQTVMRKATHHAKTALSTLLCFTSNKRIRSLFIYISEADKGFVTVFGAILDAAVHVITKETAPTEEIMQNRLSVVGKYLVLIKNAIAAIQKKVVTSS